MGRQALYACGTCAAGKTDQPAGVCLACSLHCHEGHQLYELYTKRAFRCDCGNSKFPHLTCTLTPNKEALNSDNKYNHNFQGLYCTCNRPYPDAEDEVEDEMIQCVACEDWFHSRHLQGVTPPSYEEMVCNSCMESCDFLQSYQQQTTPTTIEKESENNNDSLDVTNGSESGTRNGPCSEAGGNVADPSSASCELSRRRRGALDKPAVCRGAGYFNKKWRSQLCRCPTCKELYGTKRCSFILDESDSLPAYEARGSALPSSHDAAVAALGAMGHVQQVEAIHSYTELKTDLSDFLAGFAHQKKVVSKRDIEGFFEEMQERKKRRLESGDGVPPANCRF